MSSLWLFTAALLVVMAAAEQNDGDRGSDFAFDLAGDFEVEMASPFPAKREVTAVVGKVLHIAVPKDVFERDVKGYEVREKLVRIDRYKFLVLQKFVFVDTNQI